MAQIEVGVGQQRRPLNEVLGEDHGASPRGYSYWSRPLQCSREHFLANEMGIRNMVPDDALDAGALWHMALEAYYRTIQAYQQAHRVVIVPQQVDADGQKAAFAQIQRIAGEPGYEDMYEKLERMLGPYFRRWCGDKWEIVAVEQGVSSNRLGFDYSTRFDLMVVDHGGAEPVTRTIEHKTTYRMDYKALEGYTQDLQTLGQVWLAETEFDWTGWPPYVGSLVNVASKTKEPGYDRIPVQPSPANLEAFTYSMQRHAALLPVYEELEWPKNFTACTRRFGRCPYFDLCRSRPELGPQDYRDMVARDEPPPGFEIQRGE